MRDLPGAVGEPFHIKLEKDWYQKGDNIVTSSYLCTVTKVYPYNWWRKFLNKPFFHAIGIHIRMCEIKVTPIGYATIHYINEENLENK